ncbi:uroporphyrinogen-III C-methyltransferase [Planctomycetales bacterium]|nr:uroporphyrinogen-III C-methyltransferase [Planctomycetales bacterium]
MPGKVFLVGAGPGDPELLTLKAVKFIKQADIILHDYLIDERILQYAEPEAELVPLGTHFTGRRITQNEINERMVREALSGKTVVRLKGGDPHIFGCLYQEIGALLSEPEIEFEVVPGITSAFSAAQAAGISLTDRRFADTGAVALISGHRPHNPSLPEPDFRKYALFPGTLVFYMGMSSAVHWSSELIAGGKSPDTPVLFVFNAAMPNQRVVRTTLCDIEKTVQNENLRNPCSVIVGQTVNSKYK